MGNCSSSTGVERTYRLTEKRLAGANATLEKCRVKLFVDKSFDAHDLEQELRAVWKIGYQEMKSIAGDLLKQKRYREVAAFYMENIGGACVPSEFKQPLASLYGMKVLDAPELKDMRDRFWAGVFKSRQM